MLITTKCLGRMEYCSRCLIINSGFILVTCNFVLVYNHFKTCKISVVGNERIKLHLRCCFKWALICHDNMEMSYSVLQALGNNVQTLLT